jgi:hypothetical protein
MSTIRDERDLSDIWTETPKTKAQKRAEKKKKEERVSKEMLRRVAEFVEARQDPAKRVGEDRPQQDIHIVDGGEKLPRAQIHVEDEEEWLPGPGLGSIIKVPKEEEK